MKNLNKKQKIILTIIGLCIVGLLVLGATYAWFIAVVEPGEKASVDITTDTTDNLLFDVVDNINLAINKYNFGIGGENLTSRAKATATLRANSTDNTATYSYYLYFNIESNEFVYTTTDHKPEIILTITDPNGNLVTTVEGLTYVTAGSVSGFDITTASGLFAIANNYGITSNSSTTDTIQEWNFTATFINLDSDQNDNTGKRMKGTITIRRESDSQTFADYIKNLYTEDGVNNLYMHDGIGDYTTLESGDNSYRYSGGDFEISPDYASVYKKINMTNIADTDAIVGFNCSGEVKIVGTSCAAANSPYYFLLYDNKEEKTQYATYQEAVEQAISDSYIISKPVNNFVCFGNDSSNCPYDNLYRIIGVFDDKVKLIKYDYATQSLLGSDGDYTSEQITPTTKYRGHLSVIDSFYWNNTNYDSTYVSTEYWNVWSYSALNLINLNKNFLKNIGEKWLFYISDNTWHISGGTAANLYSASTAKKAYNYELGTSKTDRFEPYIGMIGIPYLSEYYYAASPKMWGKAGTRAADYRYAIYENWMYMGISEWAISPISGTTAAIKKRVGFFTVSGNVTYASSVQNKYAVRPTFFLENFTAYKSGDGTIENPYRIGV